MSKNFITLLFTSSKTEPAFPSASRLCELNVDISWTRTTYLCATAYPCFKSFKFKIPNSKFVSPRNFSLFYYSLSNKLYERCVVVIVILVLFFLFFLFSLFQYYRTSSWWRIRESNPWPSACKADALANWANPPVLVSGFKFQVSSCFHTWNFEL